MASISSTYKRIIDNFNMQNTLILDGAIYVFDTKKTKLTNLEIIKKESVYFFTWRKFCKGQKSLGKDEAHTIA